MQHQFGLRHSVTRQIYLSQFSANSHRLFLVNAMTRTARDWLTLTFFHINLPVQKLTLLLSINLSIMYWVWLSVSHDFSCAQVIYVQKAPDFSHLVLPLLQLHRCLNSGCHKLWNNLPAKIFRSPTLAYFKHELDKWLHLTDYVILSN